MSLACPKCNALAGAFKLKSKLACPACGAELKTNANSVFVVVFLLWSAVSAVLLLVMPAGGLLRIMLDGAAGFTIYYVLMNGMGKVEALASEGSV